jgi:hypothetical protein
MPGPLPIINTKTFRRRMSRAAKPRIRHAKSALKAMQLRLNGLRYKQIGEALGVSEQHAWRLVVGELNILNAKRLESAEQIQRLEIQRLDEMLLAVYPKATAGDMDAIASVLSIMQRRAKLLGLDWVDKQAGKGQGAGQVNLSFTEVVVTSREQLKELTDGNGTAAPGPKCIPQMP